MTATVADPAATLRPQAPQEVNDAPAPWWVRAVALAGDVLPGAAVATTTGLAAAALPLRALWWWVCVAVAGMAILLTAANRVLLPAITGWSLGRAAMGIAVVRRDGAAAGPVRLLLRDLAHLVDTASVCVGWLWPLADERRRTFADMLVRTEVRRVGRRRPRDVPALIAVVTSAAALLCVLAATVSYVVVYRYDRAADHARAQIASHGPKIVQQMLSYGPDTLQDDFERARSLVTDTYREQLVEQQEVVQKGTPVPNEYWVSNSAVLSAAPQRATMLLFLQGQRGNPGQERLITATVRVAFAKSATGWRVDDLIVLTKPVPAGAGK